MNPWPNQIVAYEGAVDAISRGVKRLCITSPTGSGKTKMLTDMMLWATENDMPVILYTNRRMLFSQTSRALTEAGIPHGYRASGYKPAYLRSVQIAMWQTEASRVMRKKDRDLHPAKLVLIDEAHLCGGGSYQKILQAHVNDGAFLIGYTATPLDIGDYFDELLVAGRNSDCRDCGALVMATTYAPDEPDLRHIKRYKIGDVPIDLTEKENRKAIMRPGVFGRVKDAWLLHNPQQRPTILFGPDVAGSLFFAQEFFKAGIRSAHIDGTDCWLDGEFHSNDQETRDRIMQLSRDGEVKVVCNRFVLREGINAPWIECGIFATVFGALTSFLQSGGRLLRSSPSTGKTCIAEGSPVLTHRGLVPIEQVAYNDRLWDGTQWVGHKGVICNGTQAVITYRGLTATPDHAVYTPEGWRAIGDCAHLRLPVAETGMGRKAIRLGDCFVSDNTGTEAWRTKEWAKGVCSRNVPGMWQDFMGHVGQFGARPNEGVPRLQSAQAFSEMVMESAGWRASTLYQPQQRSVEKLWREGYSVSICLGCGRMSVGHGEPWCSTRQAIRQDRQQRTLRGGQSSVVHSATEYGTHSRTTAERNGSQVQDGVSTCQVCGQYLTEVFRNRNDATGDLPEMEVSVIQTKRRVWDILDAGPLHRFTVSGLLVHNCATIIDHGGNWWRHGSLNADREWDLSGTNYLVVGQRIEAMRERQTPEPIVCPSCTRPRSGGKRCPYCGFESHKRSRYVVQIDGALRQVDGAIIKPRYVKRKYNTAERWKKMYHRARSKKWNATFRQAEALFLLEEHYWPPRDLPFMPKNPKDMWRHVGDVPRDALISE